MKYETMKDVPEVLKSFYQEVVIQVADGMKDEVVIQHNELGEEVEVVIQVVNMVDKTLIEQIPFGEVKGLQELELVNQTHQGKRKDVVVKFIKMVNEGIRKEFFEEYQVWDEVVIATPILPTLDLEPVPKLVLLTKPQAAALGVDRDEVNAQRKAEHAKLVAAYDKKVKAHEAMVAEIIAEHAELVKEHESKEPKLVEIDQEQWLIANHRQLEVGHLKMTGIEFEGVMCSVHKEDQFGLASLESVIRTEEGINYWFANGNSLQLHNGNIDEFLVKWMQARMFLCQ